MPQILTLSKDPGDFADDGPYTHAKITRFIIDFEASTMEVHLHFGTMSDETFTRGTISKEVIVHIEGDDYLELLGSNEGATYAAVKSAVYTKVGQLRADLSGTPTP